MQNTENQTFLRGSVQWFISGVLSDAWEMSICKVVEHWDKSPFFFPFPRFIIKNRSSRVGRSLWQAVVASFFMRFILTRGVLAAPACTCQHRSGWLIFPKCFSAFFGLWVAGRRRRRHHHLGNTRIMVSANIAVSFSAKFEDFRERNLHLVTRPGKHTKSYWKWRIYSWFTH
jgi:hypothetical protein